MDTLSHSQVLEDYQVYPNNKYADLYFNRETQIIVCILTTDYIPIERFKDTFNNILELTKTKQYRKLVFDKRAFRTFHQPSMEWYFLHWKNQAADNGLTIHRKILPDLEWFRHAVAVARKDIMTRDTEGLIERLDMKYCNSIEEALNV